MAIDRTEKITKSLLPMRISVPAMAEHAIIPNGLNPTGDPVEDCEGCYCADEKDHDALQASGLKYGLFGFLVQSSLHELECGDCTFVRTVRQDG